MLDAGTTYDVVVDTNCGSFTIRLDPRESPHAAASFVALARSGYFDHTIFHRIVQGVLIAGGDPTTTGTGGPGYTTSDKPPSDAAYGRGTVAMAEAGRSPGTAGSRFFIVTASRVDLPPVYAIVGVVAKGIDVVDGIGTLSGNGRDLPSQVQHVVGAPNRIVEIERATVVTS